MQKKFLCAFAIFAVVAAMSFSEADACRRCNYDGCSGCEPAPSYIPVPVPSYHHQPCHSCAAPCSAPSYLPRHYCGNCLRRKTIRLADNCNCGC